MQDVMLKIKGTCVQMEHGKEKDSAVIEVDTQAVLTTRGNITSLSYEGCPELGTEGISTRITIGPRRVTVRRGLGDQEGLLIFEKGKRHTGYYLTPYGTMDLEMLTDDIRGLGAEGIPDRLSIDYTISLKGLLDSRNNIELTIHPREGENPHA